MMTTTKSVIKKINIKYDASVKEIVVPFDSIFNRKISHMNNFSLKVKRNYSNLAEPITNIMNIVFNESDSIALRYLAIKSRIMKDKDLYTTSEFILDMYEMINEESTKSSIINYIESNYNVGLDELSKTAKNINTELQFTDAHAKITLKVSTAQKIIIPLITEYMKMKSLRNNEFDKTIIDIFYKLFDIFTEDKSINITNKIFKLIEARVLTTRFSDKVIWGYLENLSVTSDIFVREEHRKFIIAIIPKLENDRSVVSFLHAVIRNSIQHLFTFNYPLSYKPLNPQMTDSEGLTEFDRLEINMIRVDEGFNILNKITIQEEIKNFAKKHKISMTKEEFSYYKKNVVINEVQQNLLFSLFAKNMGSYNNLYNCSFDEYIALLIIARKYLKKKNLPILADYITAIAAAPSKRKTVNKRDFLTKFVKSKKYEKLLNEKYRHCVGILIDSGTILNTVSSLSSNRFYHLPEYSEIVLDYKEGDKLEFDDEVDLIESKIEHVTDEYLNFVSHI